MSARTSYEMTREFHEAMGLAIADSPTPLEPDALLRRLTLIGEEVGELVAALCGFNVAQTNIVSAHLVSSFAAYASAARPASDLQIAKELVDVHVVVSGTAIEAGIPEDAVYEEVHRTNMAKVDGPRREDGKVLKPEGWLPPDIATILNRAWLHDSRSQSPDAR